jgi:hypothetical protein
MVKASLKELQFRQKLTGNTPDLLRKLKVPNSFYATIFRSFRLPYKSRNDSGRIQWQWLSNDFTLLYHRTCKQNSRTWNRSLSTQSHYRRSLSSWLTLP